MDRTPHDAQPTGALVSDALAHLSALFRGEVALARAELERNIRAAGIGIALILAGVVIAFVALNVLTGALVAALVAAGIPAGWAAVIVGGAYALAAFVAAMIGINALKPSRLAPTRTARNLQRDIETLKETLSHDTPR